MQLRGRRVPTVPGALDPTGRRVPTVPGALDPTGRRVPTVPGAPDPRGQRVPDTKERRVPDATDSTDAAPDAAPRCNGVPPGPSLLSPGPSPLSILSRLYLYALHGLLCELLFTALWDVCVKRDRRLIGHSSVWALPMYAAALLALEAVGRSLRRWPLPLRMLVYTAFIYQWELTWGAGLSLLGACPWDYSAFRFNFRGVVTLEYAPCWAAAALIAEKVVIKNTFRLRLE